MYPYSNQPSRDDPNPPNSYPPVTSYQYQNRPGYYRPEPQTCSSYPILKVIGGVGLILFLVALVGFHHFFWPIIFFWPFLFAGGRRYRRGYRNQWYDANPPYYHDPRYNVPPPSNYYPAQTQNPSGNYYPPQPYDPYNSPPTSKWPEPTQWPSPDNNTKES
jgi:hypothetical protein